MTATIAETSNEVAGTTLSELVIVFATHGITVVADDLLIVIATGNGAGGGHALSATVQPSGTALTQIDTCEVIDGGQSVRASAFLRKLAAGDTGITVASTDANAAQDIVGYCDRITGQHPTAPENVSAPSVGLTSNVISVLGVTTTVDDCLTYYVAGGDEQNTHTWQAGVNEHKDFGGGTNGNARVMVATKVQAAAGATGTHTCTKDTGGGGLLVGLSFAIAPALATGKSRRLLLGV